MPLSDTPPPSPIEAARICSCGGGGGGGPAGVRERVFISDAVTRSQGEKPTRPGGEAPVDFDRKGGSDTAHKIFLEWEFWGDHCSNDLSTPPSLRKTTPLPSFGFPPPSAHLFKVFLAYPVAREASLMLPKTTEEPSAYRSSTDLLAGAGTPGVRGALLVL